MLDKIEDNQLLFQLKENNEKAFRTLFDSYYEELVRHGLIYLKDLNPAKDAVQDVFLDLWKNRHKINIQHSLKAYLKRSVTNRCLNYIKSQKLHGGNSEIISHSKSVSEGNPLQSSEFEELKDLVNYSIDQLPERCQLVFKLCRLDGLSHKEIAEKLNISTKTVENQITKALKFLKTQILPYLQDNQNINTWIVLLIFMDYLCGSIGVLSI